MKTVYVVFVICLLLVSTPALAKKSKDKRECEVVKKVLSDIQAAVSKEDRKSLSTWEAAIDEVCGKSKRQSKEKKACYYLTNIKRKVGGMLVRGLPVDRIGKKLSKSNPELCQLRFPVKVKSKSKDEIAKLRVKELKRILRDRNVDCNGCLEKSDYVKRVIQTMHMDEL